MPIELDVSSIRYFTRPHKDIEFEDCNCQITLVNKTKSIIEQILQNPKFVSLLQEFTSHLPSSDQANSFEVRIQRSYIAITPLDPACAAQTRTFKIEEDKENDLFTLDGALVDKATEVWQKHLAHAPDDADEATEDDSSSRGTSSARGSRAAAAARDPSAAARRRTAHSGGGTIDGVKFRMHADEDESDDEDDLSASAAAPSRSSAAPRADAFKARLRKLQTYRITANAFKALGSNDGSALAATFVANAVEADRNRIYHHVFLHVPPSSAEESNPEYGKLSFSNTEGYPTLSNAQRARAINNFILEETANLFARAGNRPSLELQVFFNQLSPDDKTAIFTQLNSMRPKDAAHTDEYHFFHVVTAAQRAAAINNTITELNRP